MNWWIFGSDEPEPVDEIREETIDLYGLTFTYLDGSTEYFEVSEAEILDGGYQIYGPDTIGMGEESLTLNGPPKRFVPYETLKKPPRKEVIGEVTIEYHYYQDYRSFMGDWIENPAEIETLDVSVVYNEEE